MSRLAGVLTVAAALLSAFTASAFGATGWQQPETIDLVRGIPSPGVAIDDNGKAVVAYSSSDAVAAPLGAPLGSPPQTWLAVRDPGRKFVARGAQLDGDEPVVASNGAGATVVAAVDDGRLAYMTYPAPGASGTLTSVEAAGASVSRPAVGIDGGGGVTVAWVSPPRSGPAVGPTVNGVFALRPGGTVQKLYEGTACGDLSLDVNARGDAVVAVECTAEPGIFVSGAGQASFGPRETPFGPADDPSRVGASLDAGGTVHAFQSSGPYLEGAGYRVLYASRPSTGPFDVARHVAAVADYGRDFAMDVQDDGRVVAAWRTLAEDRPGVPDGEIRFVVKAAGSADFAPVGTQRPKQPPSSIEVDAATTGPALVSWIGGSPNGTGQVAVATVPATGSVGSISYLGTRGDIRSVPAFAINSRGQAVGAWEQRCSANGAFAVMAVALDDSGSRAEPPCQDTRAPKVIVVSKRAALRGRTLRARVACDEVCRLTASARVLRAGKRKPIATAKTRSEQRLAARRGAWVRLRLSGAEVRRIALAKRARRKVTVRLGVSVRDVYGTGRIWRLRVPLR